MKLYTQNEKDLISEPPYYDLNSLTNFPSQNMNLCSTITALLFLPDLKGIKMVPSHVTHRLPPR